MMPEEEKRRAQEDGYISCSECGHDIYKDHNNIGCDACGGCFICDCTMSLDEVELTALYEAYGMVFEPY